MPTTLPDTFGRYRIQKKLGEGGMGAVYLAEDSRLGRRVALKVPHFNDNQNSTILDRFYREARMAARIEHPNLCPIYDVDCQDGIHFITMAYVDGTPLSKLIGEDKPWQPGHALELVRQMALALSVLHDAGIIHRDLKPGNVMIRTKDNVPIIMDFGLARSFQHQSQNLTGNQSPLGTPAYMSPEQVMADPNAIGPRSDIYSLGVILYELLTGRLPFGGSVVQVFAAILHTNPPAPGQLRNDLPPQLDAVVLQAMAKNPADRPESMQAFAAMLQNVSHQVGTQPDGSMFGGRAMQPLNTMQPGSGSHQALRQTPGMQQPQQNPTPPAWSQNPVPMPSSWGAPPPSATPHMSAGWQQVPHHPPSTGGGGPMPAPQTGTPWQGQPPQGSWGQTPAYGQAPPSYGQPPSMPSNWQGGSGTHPGMQSNTATRPPGSGGQTALLIVAVLIFLLCLGVSAWFIYIIANGGIGAGRSGAVEATQPGGIGGGGVATTTGSGGGSPGSTQSGTRPTGSASTRREVVEPQPKVATIRLTLPTKQLKIEAGKSEMLAVEMERENFGGAVTIEAFNPPMGIEIAPLSLLNGENSGNLLVRIDAKVPPGEQRVQLRASAEHQGKPLRDVANIMIQVTPRPIVEEPHFINSIGMKLVRIKPGQFEMGTPMEENEAATDQRPVRTVTISKPYYLGAYEVTQAEYEKVMGKTANRSSFRVGGVNQSLLPKGEVDTLQYPADTVSWLEAVDFCKKLSEREDEKKAGRSYRLPTEAEWEYACRAGSKGPYNTGNQLTSEEANYDGTRPFANIPVKTYRKRTMPVGQFKPNAWGLYDMHGNIAEWCSDWYDEGYYLKKENTDPQGPETSGEGLRVLRGGWWMSSGSNIRSGARDQAKPDVDSATHRSGFRVLCVVKP